MGEKNCWKVSLFQIDQQLTIKKYHFCPNLSHASFLIHYLKMGMGLIIIHKIKHILWEYFNELETPEESQKYS